MRQKSSPGNRSCQGSYGSSYQVAHPGSCLDRASRDARLLPGHQIWGLTPGFAATCQDTLSSHQKIFRERLFSGYRGLSYEIVSLA